MLNRPSLLTRNKKQSQPRLYPFITAVVALSSIGPLLNLQNLADPVYWRTSATALMLSPFCVHSIREQGFPKLSVLQAFTCFLVAVSYAAMNTACFVSPTYTAIGNAVIFSNSQALILLLAKLFVGDSILL